MCSPLQLRHPAVHKHGSALALNECSRAAKLCRGEHTCFYEYMQPGSRIELQTRRTSQRFQDRIENTEHVSEVPWPNCKHGACLRGSLTELQTRSTSQSFPDRIANTANVSEVPGSNWKHGTRLRGFLIEFQTRHTSQRFPDLKGSQENSWCVCARPQNSTDLSESLSILTQDTVQKVQEMYKCRGMRWANV
jgi:hypothetical protein